jgi:hypothetical protein
MDVHAERDLIAPDLNETIRGRLLFHAPNLTHVS